jgi:DNA-binding NarL/FixJ family response regulator
MVLSGLTRYCLESGRYDVVRIARTPQAMRIRLREISPDMLPDIVVIECDVAQSDTLSTLDDIRQEYPSLAIVLIGDYTVPSMVNRAFQHGAKAYLLAMPLKEQLLETLDRVCAGSVVLDKQLRHLLPTLSPPTFFPPTFSTPSSSPDLLPALQSCGEITVV